MTRSSQGRFDEALADLGQARVQLLRSGDALAVARVDANLGNVEMDRERPAQAVGYFRKATRDFESMGAVNELAGTGGMLVTAELQLLQPDAALKESARTWALLPRIRDPAQRANVILGRAEALIAIGRLGEADRLLRMPETATVVPGDYKRREFLRMELARQGDDPREVVRIADAALATWPPERRPHLRAWMQVRRELAAQRLDLPSAAGRDAVLGDDLPQQLLRAIRQGASGDPGAEAGYPRRAGAGRTTGDSRKRSPKPSVPTPTGCCRAGRRRRRVAWRDGSRRGWNRISHSRCCSWSCTHGSASASNGKPRWRTHAPSRANVRSRRRCWRRLRPQPHRAR